MADKMKVGAGIALDGEKEYRQAVAGINKDMAVLTSEMSKVSAQYAGNADSITALTSKSDIYNKQIDEQKKKIETLKTALENSTKEYGEADKKTKEWRIQLNNAEAQLFKTEAALKDTTEQAGKLNKIDFSKLSSGLKSVGDIAGKMALAIGAAMTAAAAGVGAMTVKAAYAADDINTLAKQTGLSTSEIQKFKFASEQIDVPLETLTGSMAKLTRNMATARKGTGDVSAAFKSLGVNVTDNNGQLRSNQDVFYETINALGKIENATERDALSMAIFGKSAQDLNPLILGGGDALKELGDQAESAGLILGQDSLDNLNLLADAIDTFKATISGSGNLFATAFAGPMADAINTVTGYIQRLAGAFNESGFSGMVDEIGNILSEILEKIIEYLPQFSETATSMMMKLVDTIIENLPEIVQVAIRIIITLAAGLVKSIPKLISAVPSLIKALVDAFTASWPDILQIGVDLVKGIWEGIKSMGDWLWDMVSGFFDDVIDKIKGELGIHSPSTVFAGIGKNMASGLGEGFAAQMAEVARNIQTSIPLTVNAAGAGGFNVNINNIFNEANAQSATTITRQIDKYLGQKYGR